MAYEVQRYAATALRILRDARRVRYSDRHPPWCGGLSARLYPPPPAATRDDTRRDRSNPDNVPYECQPLYAVDLRHHFYPRPTRDRNNVAGSSARRCRAGHWAGAAG